MTIWFAVISGKLVHAGAVASDAQDRHGVGHKFLCCDEFSISRSTKKS